jgi:hypothetical protein
MAVTHLFISAIPDGPDVALVRPSNWNANHIGTNDHGHTGVNDGNLVSHLILTNIGVNTHLQIDAHITSAANPHGTTAAQVGAPALVNPSVINNFVSFAGITGLQQDSGYNATSFAGIVHVHPYVPLIGGTMSGDLIGTDFIKTRDGTITRVGNLVSQVALVGGRTIAITRDVNDRISTVADGAHTWTYTRDINGFVTSWTIT